MINTFSCTTFSCLTCTRPTEVLTSLASRATFPVGLSLSLIMRKESEKKKKKKKKARAFKMRIKHSNMSIRISQSITCIDDNAHSRCKRYPSYVKFDAVPVNSHQTRKGIIYISIIVTILTHIPSECDTYTHINSKGDV